MKFEFNILLSQDPMSAMYLCSAKHSWNPDILSGEYVTDIDALADAVKGRSSYIIADAADVRLTRKMFATNNILVVADYVPDINESPVFWSNLLQATAIACDDWTKRDLLLQLPSLSKRFINLTSVVIPRDCQVDFVNGEDSITYAGPIDAFYNALSDYVTHTAFLDRKDGSKIKVDTSIERENAYYNVLIAPYTRSSLWLTAMAHRSNLVLFSYNPERSYNMDPRGMSSTVEALVMHLEELSGSTRFKAHVEQLMDEYTPLVSSLRVNSYKRPKGCTLVDRLFAEVNRSGF